MILLVVVVSIVLLTDSAILLTGKLNWFFCRHASQHMSKQHITNIHLDIVRVREAYQQIWPQHVPHFPHDTVRMQTRFKFRVTVLAIVAVNLLKRGRQQRNPRYRYLWYTKQPCQIVRSKFRTAVYVVIVLNQFTTRLRSLQETKFQVALQQTLSGVCDSKCIATLLSSSSRPQTLPEFYAAHNLLMFAVSDGFIPAATTYNKSLFYWFENIYLPIRQYRNMSEEDLNMVKKALHEAQAVGVLESGEPVLTGLHVTSDLLQEARQIQHAIVVLCRSIVCVDDQVSALVKSFDSHKRVRRYSTLVGIALNLIPIAGGAIAGVISSAAEVVEGLSIKDVADYAFGLGSELVEDHVVENGLSIGDKMLQNGSIMLSDESLASMGVEQRKNLEALIGRCGYTVQSLREEFLSCMQFTEKESVLQKVTVEEVQEDNSCKSNTPPLNFDTSCEMDAVEGSPTLDELKKMPLSKSWLMSLGTRDLAYRWAAHIIEFDDSRRVEFNTIARRLYRVLKREHITGKALMVTEVIQRSHLEALASEILEHEGNMVITLGMQSMLQDFIASVLAERGPVFRHRAVSWT